MIAKRKKLLHQAEVVFGAGAGLCLIMAAIGVFIYQPVQGEVKGPDYANEAFECGADERYLRVARADEAVFDDICVARDDPRADASPGDEITYYVMEDSRDDDERVTADRPSYWDSLVTVTMFVGPIILVCYLILAVRILRGKPVKA